MSIFFDSLELHSLYFQAVLGFAAVINSSHLNARDDDNSPGEIEYTVIQRPKYGKLILTSLNDEVSSFTQEDINLNTLFFEQNDLAAEQLNASSKF